MTAPLKFQAFRGGEPTSGSGSRWSSRNPQTRSLELRGPRASHRFDHWCFNRHRARHDWKSDRARFGSAGAFLIPSDLFNGSVHPYRFNPVSMHKVIKQGAKALRRVPPGGITHNVLSAPWSQG